jgi:SAM-dependent methyltransferase
MSLPNEPDAAADLGIEPSDARWWELLPFTTHRIQLADGLWTTERGVVAEIDMRVRVVVDAVGGSLAGKSVVDLGCLEGGFTIAFARAGAVEAVGIEARTISHRRCEIARRFSRVRNARFVQGDVKEVLAGTADGFDVVFAAGILYHVADPFGLLRAIAASCRDVALIDTHVAVAGAPSHGCSAELVERTLGGHVWRGRTFGEYPVASDSGSKEELLWAAWSDAVSFWPVESDLVEMMRRAGFARVEKVEPDPSGASGGWQVELTNRVMYLCHKR